MDMRQMRNVELGERVVVDGRVYRLRGFSPMSVTPQRVLLEEPVSGRTIELDASELETALRRHRHPPSQD